MPLWRLECLRGWLLRLPHVQDEHIATLVVVVVIEVDAGDRDRPRCSADYNSSVSRTVFRDGPFRFFFFSREEERSHIHVESPDGEAKFWLEPNIELARSYGLNVPDLNRIEQLVREHEQELHNAWNSHSDAKVTNISQHGFWLLLNERELFLPFDEYPWFKQASIDAILRLDQPRSGHLRWPDLDVDLSVDSLEHPERYPLKAKP